MKLKEFILLHSKEENLMDLLMSKRSEIEDFELLMSTPLDPKEKDLLDGFLRIPETVEIFLDEYLWILVKSILVREVNKIELPKVTYLSEKLVNDSIYNSQKVKQYGDIIYDYILSGGTRDIQ